MKKRVLILFSIIFWLFSFDISGMLINNKTKLNYINLVSEEALFPLAELTDASTDTSLTKNLSPNPSPVPLKDFKPLIRQIREFISEQQGEYGIHLIDIPTGKAFGINDRKPFVAASTTKVPINLYLHTLIARKRINPEELLVYTEEDYEEGTGSIQYQEFGSQYTIRELSRLSIEISDNVATNMLVRRLGFENVKKFMEQAVKHPVDFEDNLSTPRDMSIYLKGTLDFFKRYNEQGNELLGYFENTEFNDRIPLYLPPDTVVAHKIGNQAGALHDVGIVFAKNPFIISIMSKDVNEEQAYDVIASIARMAFDFENE